MENKFKTLLSPYRLTDKVVLKNHLTFANGLQSLNQGPEPYPAEATITQVGEICASGASLLCFNHYGSMGGGSVTDRKSGAKKASIPIYDYDDPSVHNYLCQIPAMAHMFGSKVLIRLSWPRGAGSYFGGDARSLFPLPKDCPVDWFTLNMMHSRHLTKEQMLEGISSKEMIQQVIQQIVDLAKKYKGWGYDGMDFRVDRYISASLNLRTDEYGGEVENRARFVYELFDAVKKQVGKDFLIQAAMPGKQDHGGCYDVPHGYTLEETVRFAKLVEGKVDILQLREETDTGYQRTGYCCPADNPHNTLDYCKAVKNAGVKTTLAASTGFYDPEDIERALESGSCDLIAATRAFLAEPQYTKKLYSFMITGKDRPTPCIQCNKCHGELNQRRLSICSVNPRVSLGHRLPPFEKKPLNLKKVAVIGGGVIGMRAACFTAERGHTVTLYEKRGRLGGKVKSYSDMFDFMWPLKRYNEWLIEELDRCGVAVKLNHEPKPEELASEGYDAIIAATGSLAIKPPVPGAEDRAIWTPEDVYENRAKLGQKVAVVGGSSIPVDVAIYLAKQGKDVVLVSRQKDLANDIRLAHDGLHESVPKFYPELGYGCMIPLYHSFDNLKVLTQAKTTAVTPKSITYVKDGEEVTVECDSVIVAGGYRPCQEAALAYQYCAPEFYLCGDVEDTCNNLQQGNVSAFGKACLL